MSETRPSVLLGDFLACNEFDETTRLSQIYQPVLVLTGEDDKMTPPRYAQFLADKLPHAELKIVPDAGHMLMLERAAGSCTTFARISCEHPNIAEIYDVWKIEIDNQG